MNYRYCDNNKKIIALIVLMLSFILAFSACGTDEIDISKYADEKIVLSGIAAQDIILTISDIKDMDCKTIKTNSTSDKIGNVRATGPELDTVLAQYGKSKSDYSKIRFYGCDEYDVILKKDYTEEHDIYLAFGLDGEPLDEESAPCRIIIPKSDSSYWTRMVNRIEFIE